MATRQKAKRKHGQARTSRVGTLVGIRCHNEFLRRIDEWRAWQDGELSRPAAIQRLAELGLEFEAGSSKRGFAD
jgi:hypothetical protein